MNSQLELLSSVPLVKGRKVAKGTELEPVRATDTGDVWVCPCCNKKYHLIHIDPKGKHQFEEVIE